MAINLGDYIEVVIEQRVASQQVLNVWTYQMATGDTAWDGAQIAEAFWEEVKSVQRALAAIVFGSVFESVRVRDITSSTGILGEYAVPTAEQVGTRANPAAPSPLPNFNAAGVRLTVASRITRPGQKRLPYLTESDNETGSLVSAYVTLADDLLTTFTSAMLLELGGLELGLIPVVARRNNSGLVLAAQAITGYIINPFISSQNTRKIGRGS